MMVYHFARHDGGARLVFRDVNFRQAAARAGREPANVVRDFHERAGERSNGAVGVDQLVVRGKRGELIGMRTKRQMGQLGNFARGALGEFGMRVEAGAHGGAANGQIVEAVERLFEARDVAFEQAGPASKFLADGQGRGIH